MKMRLEEYLKMLTEIFVNIILLTTVSSVNVLINKYKHILMGICVKYVLHVLLIITLYTTLLY